MAPAHSGLERPRVRRPARYAHLRQIRLRLDIKGCRSRTIILVTTLLDSVAYLSAIHD